MKPGMNIYLNDNLDEFENVSSLAKTRWMSLKMGQVCSKLGQNKKNNRAMMGHDGPGVNSPEPSAL